MSHPLFHYETAFSRTVGFVTPVELQTLRRKKVAIAGMGGVGGGHLLTLTRLGIGAFHVADFDQFEIHNFNRQAGAFLHSIGKTKVGAVSQMALQINPELEITQFDKGVTTENLQEFFQGVDVYVDGLDFFAFEARKQVFRHCHRNGIPIVTAGPIGMGSALLVFLPTGMSPERYFDWRDGDSSEELAMKFLIGLTPSMPHLRQVVWPGAIDFTEGRGPSTPMGCELCAGVAATEVMKLLLRRGKVRPAPRSIHFDAFENRLHSRTVWWGNRNPWQRLKIRFALKMLNRQIHGQRSSAGSDTGSKAA